MKTLSTLILSAFLFTSCAHFGADKTEDHTHACKDGKCDKKKKRKHAHPCLDGQCPLKKG